MAKRKSPLSELKISDILRFCVYEGLRNRHNSLFGKSIGVVEVLTFSMAIDVNVISAEFLKR